MADIPGVTNLSTWIFARLHGHFELVADWKASYSLNMFGVWNMSKFEMKPYVQLMLHDMVAGEQRWVFCKANISVS